MLKKKSIISLNTIPNAIFVLIFVVGIGAVAGLWAYEIFETDKRLPLSNNRPDENNIIQKKDAIDNEYFGNRFIQVNYPQENSIIKNPILISGKANVFEGNVRVRIKDENENILADTFITASGAYDKLYPFEKEISYTAPASQNGIIEIFEEDMKDGGDKNIIIIQVIFEDYVADVSDWKTYRNIDLGFELKLPLNVSVDKTLNDEYNRLVVFKSDKERFEVRLRKGETVSLNQYNYLDFIVSSRSILGEEEALVFKAPNGYCDGPGCSDPFIAYSAKKDTDFYNLVFYGDANLNNTEKDILSTFKFTEK